MNDRKSQLEEATEEHTNACRSYDEAIATQKELMEKLIDINDLLYRLSMRRISTWAEVVKCQLKGE